MAIINEKTLKIIRKNPFLWKLYSMTKPFFFLKNYVFDPPNIKKYKKWHKKIKSIQLNKNIPLFIDRQQEINLKLGGNGAKTESKPKIRGISK